MICQNLSSNDYIYKLQQYSHTITAVMFMSTVILHPSCNDYTLWLAQLYIIL